jgi:hypothetical protein
MKPWEHFRLVSGYLPEIDRLPETARKLRLLCRVAAMLNDGDAPHSALYWDLVEAFVESLPADSVTFEIDTDKETLSFTSVSSMRQYADRRPELGRPFERATFFFRGRATAFIDVEPWAAQGGPEPYHDSWTFAIYRETEDMMRLRDACYRVCAQHGLPVLEELHGLASPKEPPWWKRLLQWLLR